MILHTVESGQGAPVVLLHGLFGAARNFGTVQRALAQRFRVLALDLRNHGSSPHAPGHALSHARSRRAGDAGQRVTRCRLR